MYIRRNWRKLTLTKNKQMKKSIMVMLYSLIAIMFTSCTNTSDVPTASSGISKVTTKITTDINGKTSEQNNIIARYAEDNKPGSIKHLYLISAYSGQVIIYSTVKGKVTSSGKRLSPLLENQGGWEHPLVLDAIQDDGTYGSSVDYIYWWDSKGIYHQQYITGGMILHISNQPLNVKSIVLNLENTN